MSAFSFYCLLATLIVQQAQLLMLAKRIGRLSRPNIRIVIEQPDKGMPDDKAAELIRLRADLLGEPDHA